MWKTPQRGVSSRSKVVCLETPLPPSNNGPLKQSHNTHFTSYMTFFPNDKPIYHPKKGANAVGNRRLPVYVRKRDSLQTFQQPSVDNFARPFHCAVSLCRSIVPFRSALTMPIQNGVSEVRIKSVQALAVLILWRCGLSLTQVRFLRRELHQRFLDFILFLRP